jgi:hypothetical protein
MQGVGATNSGISWWPTPVFAPHLWPFAGYGYYRRFIFELTCMHPDGCDLASFNAVDANTLILILSDVSPSQVGLNETAAPFMSGQWVRGTQNVSYSWAELGSGMRFERVRIDSADRFVIDHRASCDLGSS